MCNDKEKVKAVTKCVHFSPKNRTSITFAFSLSKIDNRGIVIFVF